MKTINGYLINDSKEEILKSVPRWINGNGMRPVVGEPYTIKGHTKVKGTGTIGDWDAVALVTADESKVLTISPNTLRGRYFADKVETFYPGCEFTTELDIVDSLGATIVFNTGGTVQADKFGTTEKAPKTMYVCVKKK